MLGTEDILTISGAIVATLTGSIVYLFKKTEKQSEKTLELTEKVGHLHAEVSEQKGERRGIVEMSERVLDQIHCSMKELKDD